MLAGIQKRQWFLLFVVLSLPFLLNVVAIFQDIGTSSILKIWEGTYKPPMFIEPYNPLPEIFLKLLLILTLLGILVGFALVTSNRPFFQKQRQLFKLLEIVVIAFLIAVIFAIITGMFMPLVWLPIFHDYLLGLPVSSFMVNRSRWFIFPMTTVILFIALSFSRNKNLEIKQ